MGFVAQEVEKIIPEVVKGEDGQKAINVTGVSMSGKADINEHNRTSSDNKKESEDEKICDSREND